MDRLYMTLEQLKQLSSFLDPFKTHTYWLLAYFNVQTALAVLLAVFIVVLTTYYYRQRRKPVTEWLHASEKVSDLLNETDKAPRFRKREKIEFYARKTLHRLSIEDDVPSEASKRKKWNQRLVKRLKERFRRVVKPTLPSISTPESLLEEDVRADDAFEQNLPLEIVIMLKSVKVFWDFEKPLFLELCKHVETIELRSGDCLFRIGDPDDSIYVVLDGLIRVIAVDSDTLRNEAENEEEVQAQPETQGSRREFVINEVTREGTIHSLLSVLDNVIGNTPRHTHVYARAASDSVVLRLSTHALRTVFERHPDAIGRFVQLLATRIQRVTILAVSTYLGLSTELLSHRQIADTSLHVLRVRFDQLASHLFPRFTTVLAHQEAAETQPDDLQAPTASELDALAVTRARHPSVRRVASSPQVASTCACGSPAHEHVEAANRGRVLQPSPARERRQSDVDWFVVELANRRPGETSSASAMPSPEEVLASGEAPSYTHYYRARVRQLKAHAHAMKAKRGSSSFWITPTHFTFVDPTVAFEVLERAADASTQVAPRDALLSIVMTDVASVLGVSDWRVLRGRVHVGCVRSGTVIIRQTDLRACLFLVLSGELEVLQNASTDQSDAGVGVGVGAAHESDGSTHTLRELFNARSGELVGVLAVLSNEPSVYTVRARRDSVIACVAHADIEALIEREPRVALTLADSFLKRTQRAVRCIDFALDWMHADAGHALYRQHEAADSLYILLSGRLRSVRAGRDNEKQLVAEYGRGELLGLLEVLTQAGVRQTTMIVVRDSELVRVPQGLLNMIKTKFPAIIARRLLTLVSERILGRPLGATVATSADREPTIEPKVNRVVLQSAPPADSTGKHNQHFGVTQSNTGGTRELPTLLMLPSIFGETPIANTGVHSVAPPANATANRRAQFNTVAIVPYSDQTPIQAFTLELQLALSTMASCLRLTSEIVLRRLGAKALEPGQNYRLIGWLAEQEDNYETILYQCDVRATAWTKKCLRQADCVLLVASAAQRERDPGLLEKEIAASALKARKVLVLLHGDDEQYVVPGSTFEWLAPRVNFVSAHLHVRCAKRVFSRRRGEKLLATFGPLYEQQYDSLSDVARLARYLLGRCVALVLGGGGARGIAHVGLLRALREARVPVDFVCGTSIGALMGALLAQEQDAVRVQHKAKLFAADMSSTWHQLLDLTVPFVSWFTGERFNDVLHRLFGERQIEDLWLPYFCVTTDISWSRMKVHQTGSLWRYVRASMSLAGFVPPICDPVDGAYLLDGGYLNNLPVDVMHQLHSSSVAHVLACDVGSQDDTDLTAYGDSLSGLWLLLRRCSPFQKTPLRIPSMNDIQSRLAYVCCVRHLELVKQSAACEYIRPPVVCYKTLQFRSFDEIFDVGYRHVKQLITQWEASGFVVQLRAVNDSRACLHEHRRGVRRTNVARARLPLRTAASDARQASQVAKGRTQDSRNNTGFVHSATAIQLPQASEFDFDPRVAARQLSVDETVSQAISAGENFEYDSDEESLFDFDEFDLDYDETLELAGYDSEHAPARMCDDRQTQSDANNCCAGPSSADEAAPRGAAGATMTMSDPETWDLNSSQHSGHSGRSASIDVTQPAETDAGSSAPESGRQSPQRARAGRLSEASQRRVQFQL